MHSGITSIVSLYIAIKHQLLNFVVFVMLNSKK